VSLSQVRPAVRPARSEELPALARMLARAFLDDPVAEWAFRPDDMREVALERFQATRLRPLMGRGEVWTNDELSCAALWAAPGRWRATPREEAQITRCFLHPRLITRLPLTAIGWQLLERDHPKSPEHWYLAVLGTEPAAQGRGLGSAVLSAMLEQCDRDGVGAYLESSKERNVDFYARHGFRVSGRLRLLRGPPMWPMWRDPRS